MEMNNKSSKIKRQLD